MGSRTGKGKGSAPETTNNMQATVVIEARRFCGEGAVRAAEMRERRLSQNVQEQLLPSISIQGPQSPVRSSPLPGTATPPQLEEGRMDSLRLKQVERENNRLKREIALIKVRIACVLCAVITTFIYCVITTSNARARQRMRS